MQLISGCNATAHHIIQGSTDINPREECLMEQSVIANHNIINKGNVPTFISSNREEVTDLTLGTDKIWDLVPNWQVSDEISSEHRYTLLNVGDPDITSLTYHSPIRTKVQEVQLAANMVQQAILSFYHQNRPAKLALSPWTVPWWNTEFRCLKAGIRRLLIKVKEQVTKNHVRSPSHINIKRSERPYSPIGGTTFGGSRMNPTWPPGMSACIYLQAKKHLT